MRWKAPTSAQRREQRERPKPTAFIAPCLPTLVANPPSGPEWLHEIKVDGYRAIVVKDGDAIRVFTRNGLDWTARYTTIVAAVCHLPVRSLILDGEIAIDDANGISDFHALQAAGRLVPRACLTAFDLLSLEGRDLRDRPLTERRSMLAEVVADPLAGLRLSEAYEGAEPGKLLREACRMGLEGIVSKRRDAPYRSGRVLTWQKAKCSKEDHFAVIAVEPERGDVRSLALARLVDGKLVPCGSVGSGIAAADARVIRTMMDEGRPIVVTVEYRGITTDGMLRHPVFRRVVVSDEG